MDYHVPVLLEESIEGLNIKESGIYLDLTYGGGGHSREILKYLKSGRLIAFDQDSDAAGNVLDDEKLTFYQSNFRFFHNFLKFEKVETVDGILVDLGISSYHIEKKERGFSFRFDSNIDMRMNQNSSVSAVNILNEYDFENLNRIFFTYGELYNYKMITNSIINFRKTQKITTTNHLLRAISTNVPKNQEHKFLARIFQAIRIEVNEEIEVLKEMLLKTTEILAQGGRLVVISYHSLEDRIVKNFFKSGNFSGELIKDVYGNCITPFNLISRKAITPGQKELARNNKSRSAKLRIAEKNYE
ncbi:MAG: 16S rRNA (cytosine(1402)-N(4))-methyltransferase RsmH [Bacteroidota bacterium]